jgi:hypothetical protein
VTAQFLEALTVSLTSGGNNITLTNKCAWNKILCPLPGKGGCIYFCVWWYFLWGRFALALLPPRSVCIVCISVGLGGDLWRSSHEPNSFNFLDGPKPKYILGSSSARTMRFRILPGDPSCHKTFIPSEITIGISQTGQKHTIFFF